MMLLVIAAVASMPLVLCQEDLIPFWGSPASCSCSDVPLQGSYSAGSLALCTGCKEVRSSTDQDSCPMGWKIFSPRSKSDWDTVLASVAIPAAPSRLVDVTKPSAGCGGCSKPMNSGTPEQSEWVTKDGTAWWLRDDDYPEPNGAYTANCYLGIEEISDTSDIKFDDENCQYYSTDYLCQPAVPAPAPLVPACECRALQSPALIDVEELCSKDRSMQGQADECYPRQDGACPQGDLTECVGNIRSSIADCAAFGLRNGAKEWEEMLCYQNHRSQEQNGNYLVPESGGCPTELCMNCDLSECRDGDYQSDPRCQPKAQWTCCARRTECAAECAGFGSEGECFDCLHVPQKRDSCCAKVGILSSEECEDLVPPCDVTYCDGEADPEECRAAQRVHCCLDESLGCLGLAASALQACREKQRAECCVSLGVQDSAACSTCFPIANSGFNVAGVEGASPPGWGSAFGAVAALTTAFAHTGTGSVVMTGSISYAIRPEAPAPMTAGVTYRATWWAYASVSSGEVVRVGSVFSLSDFGLQVVPGTNVLLQPIQQGQWKQYTLEATPTVSVDIAYFVFGRVGCLFCTSTSTSTLWIDDVVVECL